MKEMMLALAFMTPWALLSTGCSGTPPAAIGVVDGKLSPCPESPNCVSTQSDDETHKGEALSFRGTLTETMAAVVRVVGKMERTTIITQSDDYLHVEYRTKIGFVDDVEFLLDKSTRTVHFRSASRVGYSDLGVNRKRMEGFSDLYRNLP